MRLVTYLPATAPASGTSYELRAYGRTGGLVEQDGHEVVLDLAHAADLRGSELPSRMRPLIEAGPLAWTLARDLVEEAATDGSIAGEPLPGPEEAPDHSWAPARSAVRLLAPLPDPASLRDFYAFEDHVRRGFAKRGEEIPDAWYELPVYYYTNHRAVLGPDETIPWPPFTDELDYEAEIAMVVGREGRGLAVEEAREHVFGYTLFNDCSARDLQRREMQVRLGPARSKGFANVLGPWIVTADEVDVTDLHVTAAIDGEVVTDSRTGDMRWSFEEMLAIVSEAETVYPGDVYGSGTVSNGCGLEHGRMLQPGETIELAADGLGTLRNPVGTR